MFYGLEVADINGNIFRFAVCEIAQGVYNFYLPA